MAEFFDGGQTMAIARLALDAYTLRHQAIAANIANINSEDYRPLRVNFEEQFSLLDLQSPAAGKRIASATPLLEEMPRSPDISPSIALDMEIVRLNQNTLKFQALASAVNKSMGLLHLAAREGRS
jgi:flagellar basal-body rod protein FlgB